MTQNTEQKWTVYRLICPNGRSYVGCTKLPLKQRWQCGRGYSRNKEMFEDIIKYGWENFEKKIIGEYESEELARRREHLEITRFDNVYNLYRGAKNRSTGNPTSKAKPVMCKETQVQYPSAYMAAQLTGIPKNKILEMCNGKIKSYHKTHWKFI